MIEYLIFLYKNRYTILISLFVFVVAVGGVYYHYSTNVIKDLKADNIALKQLVEQQATALEQLKKDYTEIIAIKEQLATDVQELQKQQEQLENKLNREQRGKKSLEQLATKKTTLVEKKINAATEAIFKCFEILSGGGIC